ncbi:hypothetical protein IWW55_000379 [Coemansia sp. RSA 2706]|nr:hypothetical protein LPJ63_004785 [Coemansia sp. RSA 2711]KAJ1844430.1 hypothetical protein LPJ70_002948 [Coemansia sp. RSA 2708]KAJ2308531.1 hypothetical protein IWW55_000379 [Coemansia sp. RSA 2706]KAJ2321182.1 hypothetical protein IWW52_000903 [Coemansia sp. RSA 2704]KAJ2329588.1 hypothetical protein IWW51_000514 [Coemansia sp. RSA 2702]
MELKESQNVGLAHWQQQNRQWRDGEVDGKTQSRTTPQPLSPRKYDYVFRKLVIDKKQLKRPLPLTDTVPMLIHGWRKTGVWPTQQPTM